MLCGLVAHASTSWQLPNPVAWCGPSSGPHGVQTMLNQNQLWFSWLSHGDTVVLMATLVYTWCMSLALLKSKNNSCPVVCSGLQWLSVVLNGYLWTSGSQWLPMDRWFSTVSSGSQWLPVILSGYQWFSIITNVSQWFWVVLKGYQWFSTVPSGSQWFP